MRLRPPFAAFAPFLVALAAACSAPSSTDGAARASTGAVDHAGAPPHLCAALRGNGEDIYAHFVSLAQLVEHFGLFDGMAGGSSSTITMFTYESILKHPALRDCSAGGTGRACTADETAARAALLLKSVRGYAEAVGVSDGILGNGGILELVSEVKSRGIAGLADTDPASAASQLRTILSKDEAARLRILINPELVAMLDVQDPQLLAYNVREIAASIANVGHWSIGDNRLFFRPGLVDFDAAAGTTFARLGDFYAGYGPSDAGAMKRFLDACAGPSKGKLWVDPSDATGGVDHLAAPDGSICGQAFATQVTAYLASAALEPTGSRIDERIGETLDALAATSVVTGGGVAAYADALAQYRSGAYPSGDIPFGLSFDDVKFGYWGAGASLGAVLSNPKGYSDEKTRKAISLGTATWRAILSRSPAEPGLARLRDLPDGALAAGGWPDLAPVLALKNLGCERVVYVTRREPESPFAIGVASKLGMTSADESALYDLSNPDSGFRRSLVEATAVWCTNWNAFTDGQMDALAADAYRAPLETRDPFFAPYAGTVASANQIGCTPGLAR